MYRPEPQKADPHAHRNGECCHEEKCECGLRNNYFEGKRLSPYSFGAEQRYHIQRRRLLNRAVFGSGVVFGFAITLPRKEARDNGTRLKIGSGLALDECGRELLQVHEHWLTFNDLLGGIEPPNRAANDAAACWLLSVHYAERHTGPVSVKGPCHCEHDEWDFECETVRYSLKKVDCDECCPDADCELDCRCGAAGFCSDKDRTGKRAASRCMCEYTAQLEFDCECGGALSEIEEPCAHVAVDRHNSIPLACVKLAVDDCGEWVFAEVDACGPRRLVKSNALLFDLIRGCDLTKISKIGWEPWHRREAPIPFDEFSPSLGADGDGQAEYITRDFWVEFSRPVRRNTVTPECFAITVISGEREGGWWQTFRVPITRVQMDRGDMVTRAAIVVDGAWVEDAVRGRKSLFRDRETRVEIEVRGDFIVDCNGMPVDANAVGLIPAPTGNGTPGGTFLSAFVVIANEPGYVAAR
jgi:hypothetical protein